ncbi:hypothetical protein Pla108_34890 [Botrimarina colliarenosi]|uniref:Uncharacterized protein n=1 Tax=Botrimarina colliarenosi TaxID=2528001 RepID=A0A5C6AAI6_9BACT|nr:hypothetical protein [Botrimarina colliarenosi]TWT95343.1 hypothetical protein Pla108_34890 [Botrimarina colliarenosi]
MKRTLLSLTVMASLQAAGAARAIELPQIDSFDTRTPEVSFDVPATLTCRDVTSDAFRATHPDQRLVAVEAPVSLLLFHGLANKVDDIVVEIDGGDAGLTVYDYAPRTELTSELSKPTEFKETTAAEKSIGATIGAKLAPEVALTPTLSAGSSKAQSQTVTRSELPPKQAVIVSGTTGGRSGVYYKLRRSSQSTLEGERTFTVTFAAPLDWQGGAIEVRCLARGEKRWLFVDQRRVWNQTAQPVELRLVSHTVAKPEMEEPPASE